MATNNYQLTDEQCPICLSFLKDPELLACGHRAVVCYECLTICAETINKDRRLICHVCMAAVGGGPRVVVSTAAFHARVRGSVPGLSGL